jgi:aryl-alcohol dehydrogenase-like predicted oxidoreductase
MVMKYNFLGNSCIKVSQLCLETMTFGSGYGRIGSVSRDDANQIVKYAIEQGINFFDTGDIYSVGDSERTLGNSVKAAAVRRDAVIVAKRKSKNSTRPADSNFLIRNGC